MQPHFSESEDVIITLFPFRSVIVLSTLTSLLLGCGANSDSKPASQVAARVNTGEITVYRVNSALGATENNVDPKTLVAARRRALDSLIDQELAAQAAESSKLDRTPAVVQAIEAARREVLARAWLDQFAASIPKADAAEVSRYYAAHPELFAQRRIYDVQQFLFSADPALVGEIRQLVDAHAPMREIAAALDQKQIKYSSASGVRTAEQIPLNILAGLSKAEPGQTLVLEQANAALVVHVVSVTPQPVAEADAAPRIRKFLANQAWTSGIAAEMKRIKQNASITYLGEFSTAEPTAKPEPSSIPVAASGLTSLYKEVAR